MNPQNVFRGQVRANFAVLGSVYRQYGCPNSDFRIYILFCDQV